jgi:hypothetical protein
LRKKTSAPPNKGAIASQDDLLDFLDTRTEEQKQQFSVINKNAIDTPIATQ